MKSLIKFILILFLFETALLAQFTYVEPGDSTLRLAVENASAWDVLVLRSGGIYTDSGDSTIVIDKNITIAAEDQYTIRPVITNTKYKTGEDLLRANLFTLLDGAQLTIKNIEFNGLMSDTSTYRALDNIIYIDGTQMSVLLSLEFEDCFFNGAMGYIVNGVGDGLMPSPMLLNLTFNQCLMTNSKGVKFEEVSLTTFSIFESTAWNIREALMNFNNDAIDPVRNADPGVVTLNYNTFDNVGSHLAEVTNATGMWNIYNCIFSNQTDTGLDLFTDLSLTTGEINNNNFYSTGSYGLNEALMADNYQVDPEYADAANGNFTLPAASILRSASEVGGAIGDPRWAEETTSVDDEVDLPEQFVLYQNYPNPFNPATTISYNLPETGLVNIQIFNVLGEKVKELLDHEMSAGYHQLVFNADNLPSGVYYCRLTSNDLTETKKMLLMK